MHVYVIQAQFIRVEQKPYQDKIHIQVKALTDLTKHRKTSIFWVKAHSGCKGNERADELAKAGAQKAAVEQMGESAAHRKAMYREAARDMWNQEW